ncbi:MAG: beta-lactamase family protein [Caulobacterales bacterium]|nr:beta-lactamase family protein [Caulobacterales bacterium]
MRRRVWRPLVRLTAGILGLAVAGGALAQTRPTPTVAPTSAADAAAEHLGFNAPKLMALRHFMQKQVDDGQIAGAVTLLARHGRIVSVDTFGKRDLVAGDPMRPDTIFRIRSETKPITGLAMMILYEEGLWTLDDPVTKFIPEFEKLQVVTGQDAEGQPILEPVSRPATMRELMTHTAGFAYGLAEDGPADTAYLRAGVLQSASMQEMIDRIAGLPLYAQPGVRWRYSAATDIQGAIIERLTGMSLADFMQSRIFGPLGMVDTGFYVPTDKLGRLATLYDMDTATNRLAQAPDRIDDLTKAPGMASGGGGLYSTATDYAHFAQMILNHGELNGVRILKPETVALMRENHLPPSFSVTSNGIRPSPLGEGVGFGLDWAVVTDPALSHQPVGKGTLSWGGSSGTWFWIDPAHDLIFIGMIQRLGGTGGGLDWTTRVLTYQALTDPAK